MNRKRLIAIFGTLMILVTLIAPIYFAPVASVEAGQYDETWHNVVEGVLDEPFPDDQPYDMDLYPYGHHSLKMGFSKYGELIGIVPGDDPDDQANWVGLEYCGVRDPFCPPTMIPMESWFNGWFIDIEYTGTALVTPRDRHVWAMAIFADGNKWGFDWQIAAEPAGEPYGGRKTNAYAETENYTVLYHGPRRFIVQMTTHIYDTNTPGTKGWKLVDVIITMIFDKVKKQVIIYKDVKLTIPKGKYVGKIDVEFSNREQWDLGPAPSYTSYAHFYDQLLKTCYDNNWHLAKDLLRERHETRTGAEMIDWDGDGVWDDLVLNVPPFGMAAGYVKVWVDDLPYTNPVFQTEPEDYTINYAAGVISFVSPPASTDRIIVHYKYIYKPGWNDRTWGHDHHIDLAQVVSSDSRYVGWTAFWPPVSDYTVDGMGIVVSPLLELRIPDVISMPEPMQSPLIIGEWDFLLDYTDVPQYRCVELKGVTDLHDADDLDRAGALDNVIDREVKFQVNEIFNPWDLWQATHKKTCRWVQKDDGNGLTRDFYFLAHPFGQVVLGDRWDKYSIFAERILVDGVLRSRNVHYVLLYDQGTPWPVTADDRPASDPAATGDVAGIRFFIPSTPALGSVLKMLYSTVDFDYRTNTDNENNALTGVADGDMDVSLFNTAANHPIEFRIFTAGQTAPAMLRIKAWDIDESSGQKDLVYLNGYYVGELSGWGAYWTIPQFKVDWWMLTGSAAGELVQIFVDVDPTVPFPQIINPAVPTTWPLNRVPATWAITVDWGELVFTPGRYEWIIVGKDSAAVDSAGAAMVSEYFDSRKNIEVTLSGLDMQDEEFGPMVPYVFEQLRPALLPDRDAYRNGTWGANTGRAKLRDDWCCHRDPVFGDWVDGVPIESSNMIGVGGFYANHLLEYLNDFTDAYFDPATGEIVALSCWSQNRYKPDDPNGDGKYDDQTVGYAVISVYKDIEGTTYFVVWGWTGQDTYYATWAIWNDWIGVKLQLEPWCVTTLIIELDYTLHPTDACFSTVVECLGTISEYDWPAGTYKQPPIHPDP